MTLGMFMCFVGGLLFGINAVPPNGWMAVGLFLIVIGLIIP